MKTLSEKLRLIYKPFLLISIGFVITYTFLHWLLFIKADIPLKEDIVKFWLPFGLPIIPILIWLRPRIKLLYFKNENGSFGYQLIACLAIAAPTMVAQEYLVTATGKFTQAENVYQLAKAERTRYYALNNYYIDKQHVVVSNTASVTGKRNEHFNMLIYVALPVVGSAADTTQAAHRYWLGKVYSERISNRLSEEEKNSQYKQFAEKCQQEFDTTDFSRFSYLEVMGNTDEHDEFTKAIKKDAGEQTEQAVVFSASKEPFAARNGNKLYWMLGAWGIGALAFFGFLLIPPFQEHSLDAFKNGIKKEDSELKEVLGFFIPREGYFITPLIINLNVLIYLMMVVAGLGLISFKAGDLLQWGANFKPVTTQGQWWRLLTSTFLHGGFMHLAANMYGLLFVGIFLEPLLGKTRYLLIYLATGVLASVASIWWYNATVSVGASGAIFGLYGFFLACLLLKVFPPDFGKAFLASTLVFIGFNLLMGFTGGIDNAAHIGGLLSGFVLGLVMSSQLKKEAELAAELETESQEL